MVNRLGESDIEFHARSRAVRPLSDVRVHERFGNSTDLTRVAVSFAGLLAAEFGAAVFRAEPQGGDPMRAWPPLERGESVLFGFLNRGKSISAHEPFEQGDILLTDDPEIAAGWPSLRTILIKNACTQDAGIPLTELTVQARSGLLDIFAGSDARPLPLPGHQIAFMTGTAAFNALLCGIVAEIRGQAAERSEVSALDIALWINWKHYLAAVTGEEKAGIGRIEDWCALPCKDGHIAFTFQDKDMAALAELTGDDFFRSEAVQSRKARGHNVALINAALSRWTRPRTREEIARQAQSLRIPVGPVLDIHELFSDVQFDQREFFKLCEDGRLLPQLPVIWHLGAGQPNADITLEP